MKAIINHIRRSAQLASILEVSGWPKPGNVHRTRDRVDARFEHFLAGAVALAPSIEAASLKGIMIARGKIKPSEIGLGKLIKRAVIDVSSSHNDGNTHLGICLLFIPLSVAAGKSYVEEGLLTKSSLMENVKSIMYSTKPIDTIRVYEAIEMVSSPNELGKISNGRAPDIYDKDLKKKIIEDNITLFDAMMEASSYDTVAKELVTGMEISFNIGFKELMEVFEDTKDINIATVHTFLRILSEYPDTFIARKVGLKREANVKKAVKVGIKETLWISEEARKIIELGGLKTEEGKKALWEFDEKLHKLGKEYNPGTTADITASSLMIALLMGLKF
ncbi:MAG: triphosphoribosyl-dephospho-CoA synthase [Candidatus Methanomethylicia archaeon]